MNTSLFIRIVIFLLLVKPLSVLSQNAAGVHFEEHLSWNQVKQKARAVNKLIFIDCFTTWCGPCKKMDTIVYPSKEISEYMNEHFISIKLQMDKGVESNGKPLNSDILNVAKYYGITSYPTFLFFSANGSLVHRESGFKMPDDFLNVAEDALNPQRQIFKLVTDYKKGDRNLTTMPYLAKNTYRVLNDRRLTYKIVKDYFKLYLNKIPVDSLLTKENIAFATWYPKALTSRDKYFKLFYTKGKIIDSIMNEQGFSQKVVDGVIAREEVYSKIYKEINGTLKPIVNLKPNWEQISQQIQDKYSKDYSERVVLDAKIRWYNVNKDWQNTIRYQVEKIDKYGLDSTVIGRYFTNNMIYELIVFHSNDTIVLKKAINWMQIIMESEGFKSPESIDTYAALLYKIGRIDEAISWEEKATNLDPGNEDLVDTLKKMQKRELNLTKD